MRRVGNLFKAEARRVPWTAAGELCNQICAWTKVLDCGYRMGQYFQTLRRDTPQTTVCPISHNSSSQNGRSLLYTVGCSQGWGVMGIRVQLTGPETSGPATCVISELVFFSREVLKLLSMLNHFFIFSYGSSYPCSGRDQVCGYCSPTGPSQDFSQMMP